MNSKLLERYRQYTERRYLAARARRANRLRTWRTRPRRKILVIAFAGSFLAMFAVGVTALFGMTWPPVGWLLVVTLYYFPLFMALRTVTDLQDVAPAAYLDEWEMTRRNSARSIGTLVTNILGVAVGLFLIIVGSFPIEWGGSIAYSGGLFVTSVLALGGGIPLMILAWNSVGSDPEDTTDTTTTSRADA
jgi:hypothetical protein